MPQDCQKCHVWVVWSRSKTREVLLLSAHALAEDSTLSESLSRLVTAMRETCLLVQHRSVGSWMSHCLSAERDWNVKGLLQEWWAEPDEGVLSSPVELFTSALSFLPVQALGPAWVSYVSFPALDAAGPRLSCKVLITCLPMVPS